MIQFGVIGAGNIAHMFCQAANKIPANLYAIASRDISKAETFQTRYGFKKAYNNYTSLFADPAVDCVYIATPHAFHFTQMMEALSYQKHIICEKPFTLNYHQAEQVFAKAKEANVFVMEAMWMRFLPCIQDVIEHIEKGSIGKVTKMESCFSFKAEPNVEKRLLSLRLGGGALLDIGIYLISLTNMILGKPNRIHSDVYKHQTGIDLKEIITYEYSDATSVMRASLIDEFAIEAIVYGTKGKIVIPYFNGAQTAKIYDLNHLLIKTLSHPHKINGLEYEIIEALDCIRQNRLESDIMPHKTTLEILKQMDELRKHWQIQYPQEDEAI